MRLSGLSSSDNIVWSTGQKKLDKTTEIYRVALSRNINHMCEVCRSHSGVIIVPCLLWCYALSFREYFPIFRRIIVPPPSPLSSPSEINSVRVHSPVVSCRLPLRKSGLDPRSVVGAICGEQSGAVTGLSLTAVQLGYDFMKGTEYFLSL
jgi:hypothetical protein